MSILYLLRAEFSLVYSELIRRKSALITMMLYPYVFTLFVLFIGYAAGSPSTFVAKVGVDPVIYMITASFMLISIFASIDDLLWRPIYDLHIGTLIYILASPVSKLMLYSVTPIPRLFILVIVGSTSIIPVYTYYYGFNGVIMGLIVMLTLIIGCLVMIPFAILIASSIHTFSESWRILNVVRPVMMILIGVYYPRAYLPLTVHLISSLIPSAPIVEVIQRMLMGISLNIHVLIPLAVLLTIAYYPLSGLSVKKWEYSKVKEGVKIS